MKKWYEYKENGSICQINLDFEAAEILKHQFSATYLMLRHILHDLFGIKKCTIQLIDKDMIFELVNGATFAILFNNAEMRLNIKDDEFTFMTNDFSYSFSLKDTPSNQAILKEMTILGQEKSIIQRLEAHALELEIHFKNSKNVLYFNIPIDLQEYFSIDYCNFLKEDASLLDLLRFYKCYFYPRQSDYDKNNCRTFLSIWNSLDDCDNPLKKGLKRDEIVLMRGERVSYQLTNLCGDVRVVLQNGIYSVYGYPSKDQSNHIPLNDIFDGLENNQRTLKL